MATTQAPDIAQHSVNEIDQVQNETELLVHFNEEQQHNVNGEQQNNAYEGQQNDNDNQIDQVDEPNTNSATNVNQNEPPRHIDISDIQNKLPENQANGENSNRELQENSQIQTGHANSTGKMKRKKRTRRGGKSRLCRVCSKHKYVNKIWNCQHRICVPCFKGLRSNLCPVCKLRINSYAPLGILNSNIPALMSDEELERMNNLQQT